MEVICGLFVSHYGAADLQIKAGSNAQDPVQHCHWRKHGRCYCVASWKGVRRKVCWERCVWMTCVLRNAAEPRKKGANECGKHVWLFKAPSFWPQDSLMKGLIITGAGQYLQPRKRQKPPLHIKTALLGVPAPSAGVTLQPNPALCSWFCTPRRPPILVSQCICVRALL